MTPEELALRLTGREIGDELVRGEEQEIAAAGLVVVFGASDDLVEFRGAINDECGADADASLDAEGLAPDFDTLCDEYDRPGLKDYFVREPGFRTIKPLWCQEAGYSWTFATDIPHSTFEIMEDGEHYCRGIVFRLTDLGE